LVLYACQPPVTVLLLFHTPVLWEYWPRMVVAREGQQSAFETKAFWNIMPSSFKRVRVCGMYLRSSLRMSSVRMKIMLGLAVSASAWVGMLPERPKESSATKYV
jgi:hypothetical protein